MTNTFTPQDREEVVMLANLQIALLEYRASKSAFAYTSPAAPETTGTADLAPTPQSAPAPTPPAVVDISTDAVVAAFRKFIAEKGTPAGRALLDKYNAPLFGDIKPEDMRAFALELA